MSRSERDQRGRRARGRSSDRVCNCRRDAVIVTAGGLGAITSLVRRNWPARLGSAPCANVSGVPEHVDGRMLAIAEAAGARVINGDRMWHYVRASTTGTRSGTGHGIRILPGPRRSGWMRGATGSRPLLSPGSTRSARSSTLSETGYDHSWFILTRRIIAKEFALSGSEQNPDITNRSWRQVLGRVVRECPGR